jgi:putative addiction module component (TIGR02574 family)
LEQLAAILLELPAPARAFLAETLGESIEDFSSPEIENAWSSEIERRVSEIRSGAVNGIPAEDVARNVRRALDEARQISSRSGTGGH